MAAVPTSTSTMQRFSRDHVWIDSDGCVGITEELFRGVPELLAVHLPLEGARIRVAEPMAALEGEKGLVDVYAPADGVVVRRNDALELEELRRAPRSTWLVRVDAEPGPLLSEEEYERLKESLPRAYPRE